MLIAILSIMLGIVLGIAMTALGVLGALRFIEGADPIAIPQPDQTELA